MWTSISIWCPTQAGLSEFIDLRVGDLRQTLQDVGGPVDFMLVDIWEVALLSLER